jgi:D-serine deaminase-like pyridoxal phosphate-dependent protein
VTLLSRFCWSAVLRDTSSSSPGDGVYRNKRCVIGHRLCGTSTAGRVITELNDQHAYLRLDAEADLGPGKLAGLGLSHPCSTLGRWRVLVVLTDDDLVINAVHAFF